MINQTRLKRKWHRKLWYVRITGAPARKKNLLMPWSETGKNNFVEYCEDGYHIVWETWGNIKKENGWSKKHLSTLTCFHGNLTKIYGGRSEKKRGRERREWEWKEKECVRKREREKEGRRVEEIPCNWQCDNMTDSYICLLVFLSKYWI